MRFNKDTQTENPPFSPMPLLYMITSWYIGYANSMAQHLLLTSQEVYKLVSLIFNEQVKIYTNSSRWITIYHQDLVKLCS